MTPIRRVLVLSAAVLLTPALVSASAPERTPEPAKKKSILGDLELPKRAVPKGSDFVVKKADLQAPEAKVSASATTYEVVRVQHAKSFMRTPKGSVPAAGKAIEQLSLNGAPPKTERFTTVVRIKSAQRLGSPIEVAFIDPRGDTTMSASGQITFRGTKGDEVDYAVDWEPTVFRTGGTYEVHVKLAGLTVGTFPLKVTEATPAP
jgi:hypothetical protein